MDFTIHDYTNGIFLVFWGVHRPPKGPIIVPRGVRGPGRNEVQGRGKRKVTASNKYENVTFSEGTPCCLTKTVNEQD